MRINPVSTPKSPMPQSAPTRAAARGVPAPVDLFESARKVAVRAQAAQAASPLGSGWANVLAWRPRVEQFAEQYQVPVNLVLAMMKLESGGINLAENASGAVGPMQITSAWDGFGDRFDPVDNVRMACRILRTLRDEHPELGWDGAICSYFSGSPYPSDKSDGYNTVRQYLATVKDNWATLDAAGLAPAAATSGPGMVLRRGDQSEAVLGMQRHLVSLGLMRAADVREGGGCFGPRTEAAVARFQREHGLPVTGVADFETRKAIRAADRDKGKASAPVAAPVLSRGAQGAAVRDWQLQLVRAGYLTPAQMSTGPGIFGPQTEAATRRFQSDHGLEPSGRVGSGTRAAMARTLSSRAPAPAGQGLAVPYISQLSSSGGADDWNAQSNCGPTSMAMIARAFGVHPEWLDGTLVNWLGEQGGVGAAGAGWPQVQAMARAAGLSAGEPMYGDDLAWVRRQLAAGNLIAANGDRRVTLDHASFDDGVSGGHWIVVTGVLPNGNFSVLDPSTDCKELSPDELRRYFNTREGGGVALAVGK